VAQGQARPATPASSATTAAEKSVRETLDAYIATYNAKDSAKLVEFFTQDGTLIDSENVATRGREAIAQEFSVGFTEPTTYTLKTTIDRVRLITPDVAQAEGVARLVSPKDPTIANQFVVLLARQGDAWKIAEIRDYPAPAESVTPQERLKIFNADGSHGVASWTRARDNQWVVKAQGSTADGRPTSTTQLISLVNKDAVKTSSIDRIIGDEIAADIEDVIMVRKPPAPGSDGTPAKDATGASPASKR
jgi:uncharacterized protein (TIGR02246 family)